jgi:hypothetical protein
LRENAIFILHSPLTHKSIAIKFQCYYWRANVQGRTDTDCLELFFNDHTLMYAAGNTFDELGPLGEVVEERKNVVQKGSKDYQQRASIIFAYVLLILIHSLIN